MGPRTRLFAPDRQEIVDLGSWFGHAPPERGCDQWKDGYSAKEQAKAWLRPGTPAVPEELWAAVEELAGGADELYARPEHRTELDDSGGPWRHDMFACARLDGRTTLVIGVVAEASESLDGDRLRTAAAATLREAQERGVDNAVLVVHEFAPSYAASGPDAAAFEAFATEFVKPGTPLHLRKVTSSLTAAA